MRDDLLLWIAVMLLGMMAKQCQAAASKPNIILFMCDDLGIGHINHNTTWAFPLNALSEDYGKPVARKRSKNSWNIIATPNLARMASEGVRATMGYAGSSVCSPSRASLMMERHVGALSCLRSNKDALISELTQPAGASNFVIELKRAGYSTAYFGKWGLGNIQGGPWNHGFDYFAGPLANIPAHAYFPQSYYSYTPSSKAPQYANETETLLVGIPENSNTQWTDKNCALDPKSPCVHINDVLMDRAFAFLNTTAASSPFFLMLSPTYPHIGNYNTLSKTTNKQAPTKTISPNRTKQPNAVLRGHASIIEQNLDRDVGRILDLLDDDGLGNNTLFIFTGDNGGSLRAPLTTFYIPNGGLRNAKGSMYDGGLRVPTIVRWPGVIPAGVVNPTPFALYDLGPTFREVAKLPSVDAVNENGKLTLAASMWKSWTKNDNAELAKQRDYLHFELCKDPGKDVDCAKATLDLREYYTKGKVFKYISNAGKRTQEFYYDLKAFPTESTQVTKSKRKLPIAEMRNTIATMLRDPFTNGC